MNGLWLALLLAPAWVGAAERSAPVSPVRVSPVVPVIEVPSLVVPGAATALPLQLQTLDVANAISQPLAASLPAAANVPVAEFEAAQAAALKSGRAAVVGVVDRTLPSSRAERVQDRKEEGGRLSSSHWDSVFDGSVARRGAIGESAIAAPAPSETSGLQGAALLTKLHEMSGRGARIKHYDEAKSYLFAAADHVTRDGKTGIVDAYSGVFVPGTGPDGGAYKEKGDQNHDGYEDRGGMNVEHVWPQSFFNKSEPMRADLHHLMATFMHPNGERGNLPFGEVTGTPEYHNDAGAKMGGGVFEPPSFAKGRVARSLLYFYTRYYDKRVFQGAFGNGFWDDNLPMLLSWNRRFPPDDFEKRRNDLVERFQGNRNPYVDDYALADRVGMQAFQTGARYGVRRGELNYGRPDVQRVADPRHVIEGARLRPFPQAPRPLRLIITGPPGAGKGTFSQKISAEYGVPHVSVGQLLRDYAKDHPDLEAIMAQGRLVDTQLVLKVVRERLAQKDVVERGFILDGFPRRPAEAAALKELLGDVSLDGVIELDVPEEELLRRILARGRADDSADVFRDRMKIYREQTVPAVELFKKDAPVLAPEVKGSSIDDNYAKVKKALADLIARLKAAARR